MIDKLQMKSRIMQKANIALDPKLLLFLIIFFGAFLRLYHLGQKSIWLDEAYVFEEAQLPLSTIYQDARIGWPRTEPFIFLALMHFYCVFVHTTSEFFLRLPSAIFGIGSIVLMYFLGNAIFNKKVALISSLLVAVSMLQVWESQQLSPYAMAMFFSVALLVAFLNFLKNQNNKNFLFFVCCALLGALLHYLIIPLAAMTFLMIIAIVRDVINKSPNKFLIRKCLTFLIVIIPFCLFLYFLFLKQRLGIGSSAGDYLSPWYFTRNSFFEHQFLFFIRTLPLFRSYLTTSQEVFGFGPIFIFHWNYQLMS